MILEYTGKSTSKKIAGIVGITVLTILIAGTAGAVGKLESEGTHFEIKNSSYLNVTLDSSEPIILTLESVPEMIMMHIFFESGAASTMITLSGLLPNTKYYKYEDDYHNHTTFTTNADGSYAYNQEISNKHLIFIQPRPSTRFINDNSTGGDCFLIGTWYTANKTCKLSSDLNETIQIDSDFISINGNGHTITGSNTGYGIYLSGRRGIAINNINVNNFSFGIFLFYSSNNTLFGINTWNNSNSGIHLFYSTRNVLKVNKALNNSYGIYMYISSNNTLIENNASNNRNGIYIQSSSDGMLSGNSALNNYENGIYLLYSSNNTLNGNKAQNNYYGINLNSSSNNTLISNNASGYKRGISIFLVESNNNTLNNNNAINNTYGIALRFSSNNTLKGNNASNNSNGISLLYSGKNNLSSNTMSDNNYNLYIEATSDAHFDNILNASNKVDGKPIYYVKNAVNQVYDSSMNIGTFYCISCNNITIQDIIPVKNSHGVYLRQTQNSRIKNVSASLNTFGIVLDYSSNNNTLTGNNASNNYLGIKLSYSSKNTLSDNNASNSGLYGINLYASSNNNNLIGNNASNNSYGISVDFSYYNTLNGNNVLNNKNYGIVLDTASSDNKIFNNIFNNINNFVIYNSKINTWNITRKAGKNIIAGPYIGGNFWARPDGKGFSQTCADADKDGICDSPYVLDFNNIDYLPLAPFDYPRVHNIGKGTNYTNIQAAINDARPGDEVHVDSGIYYENVNITKQLILRGMDVGNGTPIVDAQELGSAITLSVDGITLEGFEVKNARAYTGINVISNYNIIKTNILLNNSAGIGLTNSINNILINNNASSNFYGILLVHSNNNTLSGNNVSNNRKDGISLNSSSNNILNRNNASNNNNDGISLISSINNTLSFNNVSGNTYSGIFLYSSNNNTLSGNTASKDNDALYLSFSSNNTLIGNNVSSNTYSGIFLYFSNNNMLSSNTASKDNDGLYLFSSSNNTLIDNNVSNNTYSGIYLYYSINNMLTSNTAGSNMWGINFVSSSSNTITVNKASSNSLYGIYLHYYSSNNTIYNNYLNNTNNSYCIDSIGGNYWNTTKKAGKNIIGGSYLAGNFWAKPDGKGFSQSCTDVDRDGICDANYTLDAENIDHLPLVLPQKLPPVADCGQDMQRCENVGSPVHFNGSASYDIDGSIVSYEWEFGDGYSYKGMDNVPVHTYSLYRWNGTAYQPFIVNLTVTDNDGLMKNSSQKVIIWMAGDANGDGIVNILDASVVGLKWGTNDPCADLNNDGSVNILDASLIGLNWGKSARAQLFAS